MAMNKPREPRLRWFQYSLSTLLLAVLVVSIGMSWVAVRMQRARREREAVAAIAKLRGWARYDYEVQESRDWITGALPPGPAWLRNLLGENFFATVVNVHLDRSLCRDADLAHLKALTQLKSLSLGSTDVTDAGLERLKGLTQLHLLDVGGTDVTDAGLKHLRELTQLRMLNLGGTKVTDAGMEHLKGLPRLKGLGLWATQVTDAGLEHLKGMKQLQELDLEQTKVTYDGVKRLQQALPNCRIHNLR
jgi:hypothetical protein